MSTDFDNESKKMTLEQKRQIQSEIERLSHEAVHIEIYKLLLRDNVMGMTNNRNGVFINLKSVPDNTLWKLRQCLDYWSDSDNIMRKEENKRRKLQQKMNKRYNSKHIGEKEADCPTTNSLRHLAGTAACESEYLTVDPDNDSFVF